MFYKMSSHRTGRDYALKLSVMISPTLLDTVQIEVHMISRHLRIFYRKPAIITLIGEKLNAMLA